MVCVLRRRGVVGVVGCVGCVQVRDPKIQAIHNELAGGKTNLAATYFIEKQVQPSHPPQNPSSSHNPCNTTVEHSATAAAHGTTIHPDALTRAHARTPTPATRPTESSIGTAGSKWPDSGWDMSWPRDQTRPGAGCTTAGSQRTRTSTSTMTTTQTVRQQRTPNWPLLHRTTSHRLQNAPTTTCSCPCTPHAPFHADATAGVESPRSFPGIFV